MAAFCQEEFTSGVGGIFVITCGEGQGADHSNWHGGPKQISSVFLLRHGKHSAGCTIHGWIGVWRSGPLDGLMVMVMVTVRLWYQKLGWLDWNCLYSDLRADEETHHHCQGREN